MQEQLVFETLFSVESMQALQDEFAAATGVASIITMLGKASEWLG